jgi:oligoendopeptidase F
VSIEQSAPAVGVRWDLSDLFAGPDDPAWSSALDACLADASVFAERFRGTIAVPGGPTAARLLDGLTTLESLLDRASRAQAFARLLYAADSASDVHRGLVGRAEAAGTELRNRVLFFDLEWLAVAEPDAVRLMSAPELSGYAHYLAREREFLPHKLSEAEEKIVNEKNVGGPRAWTKLFAEITSALKFPLAEGGATRDVTLPEIMSRLYSADRSVRQDAHDTLFRVLGENSHVLTYTYDTLVQDHLTMDRLRHFPDPMHERHLTNDVPPAAVAAMMSVVEQNYDIAHDYFRYKADLLGLDRLTIYDQYAPITSAAQVTTYDEARTIVLGALERFEPRFATLAAEFFNSNWIDAEPRPGKRGGAFCAYPSPGIHPYILANYTGNRRDVMTIAHELGHAIHGQLARGHGLFNFHAPLPLAETASVFAEMLVFDDILGRETNRDARRSLIAGMIENTFATVFRQNVLTRFEEGVYAARAAGRLTTDRICAIWLDANGRYYGDALQMTEGYRLGWSYIPHFINSRFYCYAYTFGELLVLALYALYRERGAPFIPDYVTLLEGGGSRSPASALLDIGIEIDNPRFWQRGLDEMRRLVNSLREA